MGIPKLARRITLALLLASVRDCMSVPLVLVPGQTPTDQHIESRGNDASTIAVFMRRNPVYTRYKIHDTEIGEYEYTDFIFGIRPVDFDPISAGNDDVTWNVIAGTHPARSKGPRVRKLGEIHFPGPEVRSFLLGSGEPSEVDKGVLLRGSLLVKGGKTFDPEKQDPSDMDYHRVAEAMVDTRLRNLPDFCRDALKQVTDIESRERLEKEVPGLRFEELEVSGVKVWDEFRSRATAFHEKHKTQ
ncbi:hypothetical protein EV361DRAFT_442321 [Lentinula raphanica]|nr:hypothetical protein EV361DRAFT_442321 [Lentinula raphanica]